jgi:hypothetical protein
MENQDVVVHVGLHKTATTFLQREIFPKLENVNFIKLNAGHPGDILYVELDDSRINVISSESLSGYPFLVHDDVDAACRDRMAIRLNRIFPNARIIVGIRDKDDWLQSLYKQYFKTRPMNTEKTFLEFFDEGYLDHEGYISLLRELFPEVYVYRYEQLCDSPDDFVKGICDFIGVPVPDWSNVRHNVSLSDGQERIFRAISGYAFKGYRFVKRLVDKT